ncbi:hypothetical protein MASR2M79_23520 [Aminivibrio sp.]
MSPFEPDGTPVEVPKKPSSETAMHLEMYRRRDDINAVIHTHSVFATTIACMGVGTRQFIISSVFRNGSPCLFTYGTEELAKTQPTPSAASTPSSWRITDCSAVGPTMLGAFCTPRRSSFVAQIYVRARAMGDPVILPRKRWKKLQRGL